MGVKKWKARMFKKYNTGNEHLRIMATPEYKSMTIRSWSTTAKLLEIQKKKQMAVKD
jgi:uncharacterized protein (DUF1697 family)